MQVSILYVHVSSKKTSKLVAGRKEEGEARRPLQENFDEVGPLVFFFLWNGVIGLCSYGTFSFAFARNQRIGKENFPRNSYPTVFHWPPCEPKGA